MKKLIYILAVVISTISINNTIYSQQIGDLNGIYYQAVAVDEYGKEIVGMDVEGKPLYNKTISVRFTITKGLDGPVQWEETHSTITDKYGLFTLLIGKGDQTGNSLYSSLLEIPWIDADQFLKVEISTKNDGNYKLVSNQQFMAVPYAFYTDDIADDAITTSKILDSAIINDDINTSAVNSRTILNETILAEDIAEGAVTTSEVLNSTIINEDIANEAVDSRTLLDFSVVNDDIATGSIDSRAILNASIEAEDVDTGAITSSEILNETILNEDIANGEIDLESKVANILPVSNGGTGASTLTQNALLAGNGSGAIQSLGVATDGQIPIGVTGGVPVFANITAGTGVGIVNTPGGIEISSSVQEITSDPAGTFNIGNLPAGSTYTSNAINAFAVDFGDIIIGSVDVNLQGCMLTAYVSQPNVIRISIFNGTGGAVNLGTVNVRVMIVQ